MLGGADWSWKEQADLVKWTRVSMLIADVICCCVFCVCYFDILLMLVYLLLKLLFYCGEIFMFSYC